MPDQPSLSAACLWCGADDEPLVQQDDVPLCFDCHDEWLSSTPAERAEITARIREVQDA